jgi:DNA-binding SARP family transcriptional activator/pimeloyl-ACP methyl ester carboxylesterase
MVDRAGSGEAVGGMCSGCGRTIAAVQVRTLGSVAVTDAAGRELAAPERKARELLAVLVLRAPAAVTIDELADVLWDEPPPSFVKTIRAHLSRVRALLETAGLGVGVVSAGSAGYRLELPAESTDVDVIARLRARAAHLVADGRPDGAASLLAEARQLWRGEPELPATTGAMALTRTASRQHRQLVHEHLRCVVDGTNPADAIAELEGLTTADPTDEPTWVLYVQALHRCGYQVEAVRALAAARAALVEVGLVPGAPLTGLAADLYSGGTESVPVPPPVPAPARADPAVAYASAGGHHVAYLAFPAQAPRREPRAAHDLVVLNPAMITIDGLLDEPHARHAVDRLQQVARVVCLDRSGIGLSDPLPDDRDPLEQWTDDVVHVLDSLAIEAADVMASFDTGLVAIELAARHPDRVASLVLAHCYATYARRDDYPHGPDPAAIRQLILDTVAPPAGQQHIETVFHVAPSVGGDESFRRWWTRIGQRGAGPSTATAIRTIATTADVRSRLAAVVAPTLVVHRRSCVNVDIGHANFLAEHLPHAELAIIPGTDSLWFTDTPDLIDRTIAFLR